MRSLKDIKVGDIVGVLYPEFVDTANVTNIEVLRTGYVEIHYKFSTICEGGYIIVNAYDYEHGCSRFRDKDCYDDYWYTIFADIGEFKDECVKRRVGVLGQLDNVDKVLKALEQ